MPQRIRKAAKRDDGLLRGATIGCLAVLLAAVGLLVSVRGNTSFLGTAATPPAVFPSKADPAGRPLVCGQPILKSPFTYHGASGPYRSGTPGLPTYGKPRSDFPRDTAGVVLPTGKNEYLSYQLKPDTVYYLLPGIHVGGFQADTNDAFVGGFSGGTGSILTGNYSGEGQALDSNSSIGNQHGVTIEYLTIEKYQPDVNAAAINQDANSGWTIRYNTITLNVPGAGIMAGTDNKIEANCLTRNGQYGFQSTDVDGFAADSITGGPYDVTVTGNEISYNDTCDFSGLMKNPVIGWNSYNPVPARYRNPKCGTVVGDGDQGGFKLWQTDGVTIADNYIHNNWGPGGWADTNNANTTWTDNTFVANEGPAIIEEVSSNFSITSNVMIDNDWIDGLDNASFPQPAIYISESGSDTEFGGVPACPEASCAVQKSYQSQSVIADNTLTDNGGNIFLWQNSNRYCSDGSDGSCTLFGRGKSGPFTVAGCKRNLFSAAVNTVTYIGQRTGLPREDWWDGCMWRTENVKITENTINFNPANIPDCNQAAWPTCGAGGIFSEYGSPPNKEPGWVIPTQLTFFQNNSWARNVYNGPSTFYAWNQGNGDNPVSWLAWTGSPTLGDICGSTSEHRSGYCTGPFGQDRGSTYHSFPNSSPAATPAQRASGQ